MPVSEKRANEILGFEFGGQAVKINTHYLGVSISPISKNGSGTREPIISIGGYGRVAITNSPESNNFNIPNKAQVSNAKEIAFATFTGDLQVTGATGYLRATHWFLTDDPTSTDWTRINYYGELAESRPLEKRSTITIPINELIASIEMPSN